MHHPPAPASQRVLLPCIVHSERRQLHRHCVTLPLCGLPPCLHPPLRVCSVSPSGAPCTSALSCGRLCVTIPVCVQLCDACGARHTALSAVEAEVCAPGAHACCDAASLYIQPAVHLLHAEETCHDSVCAELCVTLEIYLLRMEPCAMRPPRPACPPMPLYPPPIQPR